MQKPFPEVTVTRADGKVFDRDSVTQEGDGITALIKGKGNYKGKAPSAIRLKAHRRIFSKQQ